MSATIDTKLFMEYFKPFGMQVMKLSGKTMFPIETYYLLLSIRPRAPYGARLVSTLVL